MMKSSKLYLVGLAVITVTAAVIISCEKDEDSKPPVGISNRIDIKADSIKNILYRDAKAYGSVGDYKNITFSQYGHCWDTLETPTIDNNKTEFQNLTAKSVFTSNLTSLKPDKTYYIRSYAKTNSITIYSEIVNFQTRALEAPVVTTDSTTQIASTSVNIWGAIALDGGTDISAKGVCWGITENPTLQNQHAEFTGTQDTFKVPVTGLEKYTTYYARIYAVNQTGTGYGSNVTFKTLAEKPQLTTAEVTSITAYTATGGGSIISNGGAEITTRGICWGLDPNPTTSNNQCAASVSTDTYYCNLTSLQPAKTYHVRAFATNLTGTSYGNDVTFTTPPVSPTVTTSVVKNITSISSISGGNVTFNGGSTVTSRGVCWGLNSNPTIDNSYKTINGEGSGSFDSYLIGLNPNTIYYIRAYATNEIGTSYGNEVTFTTTIQVNDLDGNLYNTVKIGEQLWMIENLRTTKYNDGTEIPLIENTLDWKSLSSPAFCWYNNDKETYGIIYGALYNGYAVLTNKLCPTGWHTPTDAEWFILESFVDPTINDPNTTGYRGSNGGILLKSKTLWYDNGNGVDYYGFTAFPTGNRDIDGIFLNLGFACNWRTSTPYSSTHNWTRNLGYNFNGISRSSLSNRHGLSVRCMKD